MKTTSLLACAALRKGLLGLLLGLLIWPVLAQQTLRETNQALRYSRYSRISPKIIPISLEGNRILLQMPIEKLEENASLENYTLSYGVINGYDVPYSDDMLRPLSPDRMKRDTRDHFYFEEEVTLEEGAMTQVALLKVVDNRQGDEYFYHMDLKSPTIFGHPSFGAYFGNDIPFDQGYVKAGEALLFKGGRSVFSLYPFFYPQEFQSPFPPMEVKPAPVPREIEVRLESEFLINTTHAFEEEGYYFVQRDTNDTKGLLVKTVNEAFPRVATWEEMVEMVVYISTRREHEALLKAEDKKKALDQYWFNLTRDAEEAKKIIAEYFRQVEFANILFTDFKEGWKTDRGMVYIVMGPPNEVLFYENAEVWSYGSVNSNSKISFTFARVKNILTPNHYVLNRSRALQPEWFNSITLWRSGKMAF